MPQEAKVLSDKAKANGMNEAEYIKMCIRDRSLFYCTLNLHKLRRNKVSRCNQLYNCLLYTSDTQPECEDVAGVQETQAQWKYPYLRWFRSRKNIL